TLAASVAALMVVGIGHIVSTVIRQTLIQMTTPDDMRGRVFAVNSLFYGTASHLGSFRAGVMAEYIGAIGSAAIGGVAIISTVALWGVVVPALRPVGRPAEPPPFERVKRPGWRNHKNADRGVAARPDAALSRPPGGAPVHHAGGLELIEPDALGRGRLSGL